MSRTLSPAEFKAACRLRIPKQLHAFSGRIFLDVCARTHREITVNTPVDTGYLRASLAAATDSMDFPAPPTVPRGPRVPASVASTRSDAQVGSAIARAVKTRTRLTFAFTASYAVHVERWAHMVKRARAKVPRFLREAKDAALRGSRGAGVAAD